MSALGGECVYAVEKDEHASNVYLRNWGLDPYGDITDDVNEWTVRVPPHDVLCAGFPCQPFSKSGAQRGMNEARGTLFWSILRVIQERRPSVVILENVRNLVGPRHRHEWKVIVESLRTEGYRVSEDPSIFSPHLLPPDRGGRPQNRERIFVTASRVPSEYSQTLSADPAVVNKPIDDWDPIMWDLDVHLPLEPSGLNAGSELSRSEILWIEAWDEFVAITRKMRETRRLPGFPIWVDDWGKVSLSRLRRVPVWKADILRKNELFYISHKKELDAWLKRWDVLSDAFPSSRRKFEWQAQDTPSLWDAVLHFRPSGIRAKAPTYLPALVAIGQTSIIGSQARRLSIREAARLQGLPEWFEFGSQNDKETFRQLGNAVSVGAVWHVVRQHVQRDRDILKVTCPDLLRRVLKAPDSPDPLLAAMRAISSLQRVGVRSEVAS